MSKDDYIRIISRLSDRYGDKLLSLMDRYNANCLQELSKEQVKKYYEEEIKNVSDFNKEQRNI